MTFNKEKRIVKVSVQFLSDVISVFEYGEEVFGEQAAIGFTDELFEAVDNLNIIGEFTPNVATCKRQRRGIEILF